MATKMFRTKKAPDPKLQVIREQGSAGTRENHAEIKETVERLKQKTSLVHAAWLFYGDERALQKIMRMVDGCKESTLYPGWKDFAHELGVPRDVINPIDSHSFGDEGYTYYVLLHFAQLENATLHHILRALLALSRYDVITETYKLLESVADNAISEQGIHFSRDASQVLQNETVASFNSNEEDSGYFSSIGSNRDASESLEVTSQNDFGDYQELSEADGMILKPPNVRKPPLMLKYISENENEKVVTKFVHSFPQIEQECLQTSSAITVPSNPQVPPNSQVVKAKNNQKNNKSYACTVLLTFASDGIAHAKEVANILRKKRENGRRIGVLILNEHPEMVESNPYQFIVGSFPQVHYVIPIITEGYIKAATSTTPLYQSEESYLDCKYVRFIYDLMMKYYADNGCLNKKTRCIIPDALVHPMLNRTFMRQPLLGSWERLSSADALAQRWVKRFSS